MTPLGIAAFKGHQEVVELLVEVGNAQLNKQDDEGWTALHCAVEVDELETVKYLVARGCSLTIQHNAGQTALDLATLHKHPQVVQFLTSASSLITANDYSSLRSLCAPYSSSPFLSINIARQFRYATILAVHHARRLIDDYGDAAPVLPLLRRIALAPSADNSSPNTESQVFRRILSFVGAGFDYVEGEVEQQLVGMMRDAVVPLRREIAALSETNATLQQRIIELTAALDDGGGASKKCTRRE
jgi:hypothetical protein